MKRFLRNVIFFILPIGVFLILPIITLFTYKENFFPIDKILKEDEPYLIGYAYNENNYKYLKYKKLVETNKFDIWTLGSSRVLQFRKEMFDRSFYNAGYTITTVKEFVPFLQSLSRDKYPELLIISLDQWMFNETYDQLEVKPTKSQWTNSFTEYPKFNIILKVWEDILAGKYKILNINDEVKIGLNANINNKGFRNDGSMNYGIQIQKRLQNDSTADDYNFKDTFYRINTSSSRFVTGEFFNNETLPIMSELLAFCSENNIKLIAFLPPFAPDVYKLMMNSGNYKYIDQIEKQLQPYFKTYFFELYNFTDPNTIETNNNEFIDGFHGGEKTYAKILSKIIESDTSLNKYINKNLKEDIYYSDNPLILYP